MLYPNVTKLCKFFHEKSETVVTDNILALLARRDLQAVDAIIEILDKIKIL